MHIIKHLYQRTITKNGKKIKAWYYWFYGQNGKQVRKSCGQNGKPCLTKREAEAYISQLNDELLTQKTLSDFAAGMFDFDSAYLKKYFARGRVLQESSIVSKQRTLKLILDKFGTRFPSDISNGEIDEWLMSFQKSNSWRNQVLAIFKEIYKELYSYRQISYIPLFQTFPTTDKNEKGILTIQEIEKLFPHDFDELIKVWRWKTKAHEPDWQIFSFAAMIFTALSTGMRKGEFRALKHSQFIDNNVVLINSRLDQNNRDINRLKKGTDRNKRWRISILPERTVQMIKWLTENKKDGSSAYIFTFHGHPFGSTQTHTIFKEVMNKNGIDTDLRNITPHSLRFTYNTLMKAQINNADLRLMMGHLNENMTEYYDKSQAIDHVPQLLQNKDVINSVFN